MKTSHPPIRRMIYIDQQIRNRKYPNCKSIAREFEVNYKTIYRDIEYMRYQLDAPIEFDQKQNGYFYSEPDYFLPAVHLRESDVLSFIINERILSQYQNTPYYDEIKKVINKILQFLPDDVSTNDMAEFISFQQQPTSAIERHKFETIQHAIINHQRIKIKYYSQHRNEITDRDIDPYAIRNQHGNWYLIGLCHLRNEVRVFALNRILTIEITKVDFDKPSSFSIEDYLKDSFGIYRNEKTYHVKLKFSPYQARWIRERQWYKTQKLTEIKDGSLILEMDVEGLEEVKRWVMKYGAEVEVLDPEELRKDIIKEINKMQKQYTLT